eukprot:TRINITY_DN12189_c0_g1_i1.p1 TRINITY_DN12189_c0_g1~~TRINITY_DN12189_c0_g1_i1.p1  ORF type:complete len:387 (-),score=49.62 TRINITY_DN12189_c0_g1_i1:76-1236(-)
MFVNLRLYKYSQKLRAPFKSFRRNATVSSKSQGGPIGILLMNLGGPHNQSEVQPFLTRLFTDREIFKLPYQDSLGKWIAMRRAPHVAKLYAQIGGGSPIRKFTEEQGRLMAELLDKTSPETAPHKPYIAFRYASPMTSETLEQLRKDKITRVIAFSQYPQYSCTTTGSSLNELYRQLKYLNLTDAFQWSVIDRWGCHPGLLDSFSKLIKEGLMEFEEKDRSKVTILFSAHSIPMKVVDRGDPYPLEVAATVHGVMNRLEFSHPYRLVWQSKVGPLPWLGPSTEKAIKGYANLKQKYLLMVPIVFTSDHIETLYELDILYSDLAKQLGLVTKRAKALNLEPLFIQTLSDVVREHIASGNKTSNQLKLRCPMCTNEWCAAAKNYFCNA